MKSEELLTLLNKYIMKTILTTSDIKLENGVSLLIPYSIVKQNGIYICSYKTFHDMAKLKLLPLSSTFFIVDCISYYDEDLYSSDCSYFFLTCTLDKAILVFGDIFLQKKNHINQSHYLKLQQIWHQIVSIPGHTNEILAKINELYYPFNHYVACIVLRSKQAQAKMSSNDVLLLLEDLNNFFPETNIFPYKKQIVILFSQSNRPLNVLSFSYKDFYLLLQKHHMDAGISNACRQPHMYPTLYNTALSSLELGTMITSLHFKDSIYEYDDYSTFYIIDLCVKEFIRIHGHSDIIYLVSPCIIELYRYDLKHNTDLLTTLFHYLLNGCNVSITSKDIYMHRNTVFNKLKKINSIITLPLDNGRTQYKLLMSCFIVTYYREYLRRII